MNLLEINKIDEFNEEIGFDEPVSEKHYRYFSIPKKSGGTRRINAPTHSLKSAQKILQSALDGIYKPYKFTHGFVAKKGIKTNAKPHVKKKSVLNIDLQNFFPSINFRRIAGLMRAHPFNFSDELADRIAAIVCLPLCYSQQGALPQGAPTSPVLSNMICAKLDKELRLYAEQKCCYFTRYADDLTFSSYKRTHPLAWKTKIQNEEDSYARSAVNIDRHLRSIIQKNGFNVNERKIRLSCAETRQEVTGLVVNEKVNVPREFVKRTKLLINMLCKYGVEDASRIFFEKFDANKWRRGKWMLKKIDDGEFLDQNGLPHLGNVILGRLTNIRHIKGTRSATYIGMRNKFLNHLPCYDVCF